MIRHEPTGSKKPHFVGTSFAFLSQVGAVHVLGKSSPSVSACLSYRFIDSSATRHSLCLPHVTVLLLKEITHAFLGPFLLSDSRPWRGQLTRSSWLQGVKQEHTNCPLKSLSSQCFLFPHMACLCSSACWSFTGAAVWVPICLHYNYNYYFPSRSTNCIFSSFVHLLLNHLLLLSSLFGGENSLRWCWTRSYRTRNKLFLESAIYLFFFNFIYFIFCFVSDAEVSLARNKMNPRDSK